MYKYNMTQHFCQSLKWLSYFRFKWFLLMSANVTFPLRCFKSTNVSQSIFLSKKGKPKSNELSWLIFQNLKLIVFLFVLPSFLELRKFRFCIGRIGWLIRIHFSKSIRRHRPEEITDYKRHLVTKMFLWNDVSTLK